jgi:hypothetical protein
MKEYQPANLHTVLFEELTALNCLLYSGSKLSGETLVQYHVLVQKL